MKNQPNSPNLITKSRVKSAQKRQQLPIFAKKLNQLGESTNIAHKSRLYLSPSHLAGGVALSTLLLSGVLYGESVRAQSVKSWGQPNPLLNSVAGKLTLKADVGYLQNFATTWLENDKATKFYNRANGTVGYGASLAWTHTSGFGLSADYLGWANNWGDNGMQYNADYHVVTITPSYRFSFGETGAWGLKFGLGLGVSYSDITWGDGTQSAKSAQTTNKSGAIITANGPNNFTAIKTAAGAAYLDIRKDPLGVLPEGSGVTIATLCGRAALAASPLDNIIALLDSNFINNRNKCLTTNAVLTPTFTDDQLVLYLKGLTFTNNTKIQRSKLSANGYSDYTNIDNFVITPHSNLNNNFYGPVADTVLNSFWWAATNGVIAYSSVAGVTVQEFGWKAFLDTTANLDRLLTALPTDDDTTANTNETVAALETAPANANPTILNSIYNAITGANKTKLDAIIEAGKIAVGSAPASSGAAKDDVGFVIAPQITIEYDNGLLHADVNFRYIHAVKDVKYNGVGTANNDRYQLAGPLAMFIGAGFGINF